MIRGTFGEVRNGLGDPSKVLGHVEYTMKSTGTVGGPTGRSGTGRGTLVEVQDGLGDPQGRAGRVEGPSERSRMGRGTLPKVRDGSITLWKVQDGSENPR